MIIGIYRQSCVYKYICIGPCVLCIMYVYIYNLYNKTYVECKVILDSWMPGEFTDICGRVVGVTDYTAVRYLFYSVWSGLLIPCSMVSHIQYTTVWPVVKHTHFNPFNVVAFQRSREPRSINEIKRKDEPQISSVCWWFESLNLEVAFSPDSQLLVTSSDDHTARLWDVVKGDCLEVRWLKSLRCHDVLWWVDLMFDFTQWRWF